MAAVPVREDEGSIFFLARVEIRKHVVIADAPSLTCINIRGANKAVEIVRIGKKEKIMF